MTDRLPDATYLRSLAKWMMLHGIGSQTDHERLVEIGDGLEWRGIESAPKDFSTVLLWDGEPSPFCGYFVGPFEEIRDEYQRVICESTPGSWQTGLEGVMEVHPTHWKPLPAPPVEVRHE